MGQEHPTAVVTFLADSDAVTEQLRSNMEKIDWNQCTNMWHESADQLIQNGHRVQQSDAIKLNIRYGKTDGIVKAIANISFPHLKILDLYDNKISSAEGLSRLNAQNLQQLSLSNNKLLNISSLRKVQSKIQKLWLYNNQITQISSLTQADWPNLFNIGIKLSSLSQNQSNISFCAKLQHIGSESKFTMLINAKSQLNQKIVLNALLQKYHQRQRVTINGKDEIFTKIMQK